MKVTVTTSNSTLAAMLGDSAVAAANAKRLAMGLQFHEVALYNDGSNTIFIEHGAAATVADSWPLYAGEKMAFKASELADVNVIAQNASTDLKILNVA